jgi:hypothetical protein
MFEEACGIGIVAGGDRGTPAVNDGNAREEGSVFAPELDCFVVDKDHEVVVGLGLSGCEAM